MSIYAVFKSGGKQHRVMEGQTIKLEKLLVDVGSAVEFQEIMLIAKGDDIQVGSPLLKGAKIMGTVVEQARHDKVKIVKFRRRKHHKKSQGHRQYYTAVKIEKIAA
jgi:large subunit ribosomal protein L21